MSARTQLKRLRQSLELNQAQMAQKLKVSQPYYSAVESGKKSLTRKMIRSIENLWNVGGDWLTEDEGKKGKAIINSPKAESILNGFVSEIESTRSRRFSALKKENFNESELKIRLTNAVDEWKSAYTDRQKLTKILHQIGGPDFLLMEKFPDNFQDFKAYRKDSEEDFEEDHSDLDKKSLVLMKLATLYPEHIEHERFLLSKLIDYMFEYTDLLGGKSEAAKAK